MIWSKFFTGTILISSRRDFAKPSTSSRSNPGFGARVANENTSGISSADASTRSTPGTRRPRASAASVAGLPPRPTSTTAANRNGTLPAHEAG